jgi:hypothetical protein
MCGQGDRPEHLRVFDRCHLTPPPSLGRNLRPPSPPLSAVIVGAAALALGPRACGFCCTTRAAAVRMCAQAWHVSAAHLRWPRSPSRPRGAQQPQQPTWPNPTCAIPPTKVSRTAPGAVHTPKRVCCATSGPGGDRRTRVGQRSGRPWSLRWPQAGGGRRQRPHRAAPPLGSRAEGPSRELGGPVYRARPTDAEGSRTGPGRPG